MPQYLSPGVYIEELDVGPHPIQGVSTSTTGMVGVTVRGPTDGKPVLVTTFNDYQRTFGGFLPPPDAGTVRQWGSATNVEGGAYWTVPAGGEGILRQRRPAALREARVQQRPPRPHRGRRSGDWWRR